MVYVHICGVFSSLQVTFNMITVLSLYVYVHANENYDDGDVMVIFTLTIWHPCLLPCASFPQCVVHVAHSVRVADFVYTHVVFVALTTLPCHHLTWVHIRCRTSIFTAPTTPHDAVCVHDAVMRVKQITLYDWKLDCTHQICVHKKAAKYHLHCVLCPTHRTLFYSVEPTK